MRCPGIYAKSMIRIAVIYNNVVFKMPRIKPFEKHSLKYDHWFTDHYIVYQSELLALKKVIPQKGCGIEIGAGSGRFAAPLDISIGLEPSKKMSKLAMSRGTAIVNGIAETLPIANETFDYVLMVTTICFLDNVFKSLQEIHRILHSNGCIIIGFVDKESLIGKKYQRNKQKNIFYREANFYSVEQVIYYLGKAGFYNFLFYQTIFDLLDKMTHIEHAVPGYGEGSFVVIKGEKR